MWYSAKPGPREIVELNQTASNERLLLNIALKSGIGLVGSGLVALLASRKAGGRLFVTGLGTGAGLGYAWCQNDLHLRNPNLVQIPESAEAEFTRYNTWVASKIPSFAKFK